MPIKVALYKVYTELFEDIIQSCENLIIITVFINIETITTNNQVKIQFS